MTTRTEKRDLQRAEIMRIGLAEFNEKGYHGASTRSITSRAGVSSGLLFHYFPSKKALYEALVQYGSDHIALDDSTTSLPPLEILLQSARRVLDLLRQSTVASEMFTFMSYAESHPGISDVVDAIFTEHDLVRGTVPIIEAGQKDGSVRQGDPLALSSAFWNALQGIGIAAASDPELPLPKAEWIVGIVRNPQGAGK